MNTSLQQFLYRGNETATTEHAAALIVTEAYSAVAERGRFSMVLAGGNSPRMLYKRLAHGVSAELLEHYELPLHEGCSANAAGLIQLPSETWLFMGDERCVANDDHDSNERMVRESLLPFSGIAADHFIPMAGNEPDTEMAARAYETAIRQFFMMDGQDAMLKFPTFDMVLSGLGDDGHTASLFADDAEALQEERRWVVAVDAPNGKPPGNRVTLTLPVLNHARNVLFFTTGAAKRALVERIVAEEEASVPASLVKPLNGKLYWFSAQP